MHFDRIAFGARPAHVNLLLPHIRPVDSFAGIKTALAFASCGAAAAELPLRIITLERGGIPGDVDSVLRMFPVLRDVPKLLLAPIGDEAIAFVSPDDYWVVTHWTTAHAADVACRLDVLDPRRVTYIVQDYEPGFEPWSSRFAVIRATYHAGFHMVVNSEPLAAYIRQAEQVEIAQGAVFAPHLDLERLKAIAAARTVAARHRLFFYARPSKPRNMYEIGVATLRRALADLPPSTRSRLEVLTAGQQHEEMCLPPDVTVRALGKITWERYYDLLSEVSTGLCLMHSPHPSHPPLELSTSGGVALTNEFGSARAGLHPSIVTARADRTISPMPSIRS
jgi:hypothetical protein